MLFVKKSQEVIESRVANAIREHERKSLKPLLDKIFDFIVDINRVENMIQDSETAVRGKTGTILSVTELADFELPNIFKPLLMARSVRFANNHLPRHPDLKDYKVLGGGLSVIETDIGDIKETCDAIIATLKRNRIDVGNCKVGDVWVNLTLNDVFNNCSLKISNAKDAKRVMSLVENSISSVPVPLKDITSLVSTFNFVNTSDQWGELFKQNFKI